MRKDAFEKLPDYLAAEIRRRYIDNPAYGRLPPERELCEELGASRTSLRKALRDLEDAGALQQLPGGRIRHIQRPGWGAAEERTGRCFNPHAGDSPLTEGVVKTPEPVALKLLANDLYPGAPATVVERWQAEFGIFRRQNTTLRIQALPWEADSPNVFERMREADVLELTAGNIPALQAKELIRPLDFFLGHDRGVVPDKFNSAAWEDVKLGGQVMALPFGLLMPLMLTSRKTWRSFGAGEPPSSWTWRDFLAVASACHAATGVKPVRAINLHQLLRSVGHDFSRTASRKGAQETAALLSRILDLSDIDAPGPRMPQDPGEPFFLPVSTTGIPSLELRSDRGDFLLLPYPVEPEGVLLRSTMALMMNAATRHPVECWQLMRHLAQAAHQRRVGLSHHLVPALKAAAPSLTSAASPLGDLSFMLDGLESSRANNLDNILGFKLEHDVLAPELLRWRRGLNNAQTMLLRVQMQFGLLNAQI